MRKITLAAMALFLSLSLAACGNSGKEESTPKDSTALETDTTTEASDPQDEPESTSESQVQDDTHESTAADEAITYTVEEYVDLIQEVVAEMSDSLKDSGLTVTIEARGKSLVYKYQYINDVGDLDTVKAALEESMSSMDETNKGLLADLKKAVPDADALIYEYLDMSGEVITSIEYK